MEGKFGVAFRVEGADGLGMETLKEHYERLLGLNGGWQVADVDLELKTARA